MLNKIQAVNSAPSFTSTVNMSYAVAKHLAGNGYETAIRAFEQTEALRNNGKDDIVAITVKTEPYKQDDVRLTIYEPNGSVKQATWNTMSAKNGYTYDLSKIYDIAKSQEVPEDTDCWVTTTTIPYDPIINEIWLGTQN